MSNGTWIGGRNGSTGHRVQDLWGHWGGAMGNKNERGLMLDLGLGTSFGYAFWYDLRALDSIQTFPS